MERPQRIPVLSFANVKSFLPIMEAAEEKLDADLDKIKGNADCNQAFEEYYAVVEKGILALHADTADRNSLETLQSVYRKSHSFAKILREFLVRNES